MSSRELDSDLHAAMPWVRVLACAAGVLMAYYTLPVKWTEDSVRITLLVTIAGVALLTWAIAGQVRRQVTGDERVSLPTLVTLVLLVMAVFAWGYYALETARPGQVEGLETRTDALYFTLQLLTTVGFGDVHPVGQTARIMATAQMAFDLVFVATAGSVLASSVRSRLAERPDTRRPIPELQEEA